MAKVIMKQTQQDHSESKSKVVRKSSRIENIEDLRNYALQTLEGLRSKEVTIEEAGVIGKVCESVMSTVKASMEYARMLGAEPDIDFMDGCAGNVSKLPTRKRKAIEYKS